MLCFDKWFDKYEDDLLDAWLSSDTEETRTEFEDRAYQEYVRNCEENDHG